MRDELDDILRERLHDIEIRNGLPDWERIERSVMAIEKEEKKKRFFLFRTISGYAAAVLILIGLGFGGYTFFHNRPALINIAETVEVPESGFFGIPSGSVEATEPLGVMESVAGNVVKPEEESIVQMLDNQPGMVVIEEDDIKLPKFDKYMVESPAISPFFSDDSELTDGDYREMYDIESYMADFYELYGEEEEEEEVHKGWDFFFMAGVLSINKNTDYLDNTFSTNLSFNKYDGEKHTVDDAIIMIDNDLVVDFFENHAGIMSEDTYEKLSHRFPLSLGVWFGRDLGNRWGLESGLLYSYMESYSGYESWTSINYEQQLSYLGIPLSLSYSLLPERSMWNVDLRGGLTAEKALSAKGVTTVYENYIVTKSSVNEDVPANIMYSANLGFGFGYTLFRGFGLYVEPALGYYFYTKGQPVSYKTDNPFRFNIRAGVRLDF